MAHIYCDTIKNISWKKSNPKLFAGDSVAGIWRIKVSDDKKLHDFFYELLSPQEKQKAVKYHQEKDKERFITSRGALRFLLASYLNMEPASIEFIPGPNKKPLLASKYNLHFNTSHSGDWILIVIADREVGIDVEKINNNFSYQEIIELNFNKEEKEFIRHSDHPAKDFYLLWTRKEALVKATGKGVDEDLTFIPSMHGFHERENKILHSTEAWNVNSFDLDEQHIGSIATSRKITAINFLDTSALFFLQPV